MSLFEGGEDENKAGAMRGFVGSNGEVPMDSEGLEALENNELAGTVLVVVTDRHPPITVPVEQYVPLHVSWWVRLWQKIKGVLRG